MLIGDNGVKLATEDIAKIKQEKEDASEDNADDEKGEATDKAPSQRLPS